MTLIRWKMPLVDLHTHGLAGMDSRTADPEEYLRLAESYMAHGTAAFLPTVFPGPVEQMRDQLGAIKRAMEIQGNTPSSPLNLKGDRGGLFPTGGSGSALILGAHLEGPFVNPEKAGALPREHFLPATADNLKRLLDGFEGVVRLITVAPELPGALGVIEEAAARGIRVNMGHSAATFAEAKDGRKAGATGVTHLFNAMPQMHHREPGLAGYALTDDTLYVELIADMAHVHPAMLMLVTRCKPHDRVILVSDSLLAAKTEGVPPRGPIYMPGGKTLAGSGITLADAVRNLVSLGVPEEQAGMYASQNPARYIGVLPENL